MVPPQEYINALAYFIGVGAYRMHGDNLHEVCRELAMAMDQGYTVHWPNSLSVVTWISFAAFSTRKPGAA